MDRIPFGIRRLDTTIGGGAPPGSVVLLSGDAGAGAREFMYTSAVMNGLAEVYMNSRAPAPASPDRRTTLPGGAPPPMVVSSRLIPNGIRSIPLSSDGAP